MIIDPYGVTLASASTDREELVLAEVSEEAITSVRNKMAVFAQRRPDVYGRDAFPRRPLIPASASAANSRTPRSDVPLP